MATADIVGDDVFGRFMRESLAGRGLNVTAVATDRNVPAGLAIHLLVSDLLIDFAHKEHFRAEPAIA